MSQTRSPSTQQVYGLARVCRVWEVARSTVYATKGRAAAPVAPQRRGPEAAVERRGPTQRDPGRAGGGALSGRGPSQGLGAAAVARSPHLEGARAAPDAGGPPAGAHPRRPCAWAHGPRRHDHHGAARSDVGDGRDELSDAPRGHGHRLRGRGSLRGRGASGCTPPSRGRASKPSSRCGKGCMRSSGATPPASPAGSRRGTITAASTSATISRTS